MTTFYKLCKDFGFDKVNKFNIIFAMYSKKYFQDRKKYTVAFKDIVDYITFLSYEYTLKDLKNMIDKKEV